MNIIVDQSDESNPVASLTSFCDPSQVGFLHIEYVKLSIHLRTFMFANRFANSSLQTIFIWFFRRTQRMFAAQWVPCSSKFLFSSMFVGSFSYFTNSFHISAGAVGSLFSPGLSKVRGKINFPNMFANMHA